MMSGFHRVYNIWKEERRLRKMFENKLNLFVWAPDFTEELDLYSKAWFQAIKEGAIEQQTIKGHIVGIEGDATDGRGFPIFTLESSGCKSIWERKSHAGVLQRYPDDDFYQLGKEVEVTFVRCNRGSGAKLDAETERFSRIVLFLDVER